MLIRKALLLGICTGIISALGATGYANMYNTTLFDYSADLGYLTIAGTCIFISVAVSLVFWVAVIGLGKWGELVFNIVFCVGTMMSIEIPMNAKIANEIPDFYPVYAIPLHFFPVLAWMGLRGFIFPLQIHPLVDTGNDEILDGG